MGVLLNVFKARTFVNNVTSHERKKYWLTCNAGKTQKHATFIIMAYVTSSVSFLSFSNPLQRWNIFV